MFKALQPNKQGVKITSIGVSSYNKSSAGLIGFFILHYGMFTFIHGVFLMMLISKQLNFNLTLLIGITLLFISHGVSYFVNYVGNKEYERVSAEQLMGAPYVRIVVMHLTVLFGSAFVINLNGNTCGPLIILTVLKTIVDLFSHNSEHNKLVPDFFGSSEGTLNSKVFYINPKIVSRFFPNYEKLVADAYKTAVDTGKWDEIKAQMDPVSETDRRLLENTYLGR